MELNKKTYKQDFADYWETSCDQAYQQLRAALASKPVLALNDPELRTRVETDASDIGMGAVLTQCHGDDITDPVNWKPVEYYSKRWNTSQRNYHPAEKETCAIIYALLHWQHLLFGQQFTILTDSKVAHYLQTKGTERPSQRDIHWMEKLQFFAPFEIQYRPGAENIVAHYLSKHPPEGRTHDKAIFCILDLCAGMGTVLRALELACSTRSCQIDYIAVEQDPSCRLVIQIVFNFIRLAAPGLFVRTDIFRLGHDVKALAGRRKLPSVNLVIADVPCQPFSRANTTKEAAPLGLLDTRELFSSVRLLLDRLPGTHYVIECTPFADHLTDHLETVQEWFGEPQLHYMSKFSPQTRQRLVWTTIGMHSKASQHYFPELPLTWAECLDSGSTPPVDSYGLPLEKCPTLMASPNSHSDRSKSAWVHGPDHELRPLSINEKERLTGMQPGDTQAYGVPDSLRHQMSGNAFPVGWIASILRTAITLHISTPELGFACASHRLSLYTQASRLKARHSLHVQNLASIAQQSHDPSSTELSESSIPQETTPLPSLLDRIHTATKADFEYLQQLESSPAQYAKHLGLLFQRPQPYEANFGPAILIVPNDAALRQDLLHLIHDQCHFGQARTWAELRRHFYWPWCKHHCTLFVQQCPTCQLQKPGTRSRYQHLFPESKFYPHPFHTIVLDVVDGFPLSKQGHNAVITVVDKFTKFAVYIPIHTGWSAIR